VSPRHSDSGSGWIKREFAKIRKQMREDRAAKNLQAATIGKGGVTVKDGGSFLSKYLNGAEGARVGPLASGIGHGITLADENFGAVFLAYRILPTDVDPDGGQFIYMAGDDITMSSRLGDAFLDLSSSHIQLEAGSGFVGLRGAGGVLVQHSTTGATANCFIDPSDGRLWREVSAAKYKADIEDAKVDVDAVLKMRPITYRDKGEVERDPDTERRYVGLLAEDLAELGLTEFVVHNDDGEVEGIAYPRLTVALLAVLQDQERRLRALESADEGSTES